MKKTLLAFSVLLATQIYCQTVAAYFEKIRNNAAELTAFFSQMPKGGDLHHHFSGSVYAETFLEGVISSNFFINKATIQVKDTLTKTDTSRDWVRFDALDSSGLLNEYKHRLLRQWSAKDYNETDYPSHRQFFESFDHFGVAVDTTMKKGLLEIKRRAKSENVAYIETMLKSIRCGINVNDFFGQGERLRKFGAARQGVLVQNLLDSIYTVLQQKNIAGCAIQYNAALTTLHQSLKMDDSSFTMRYQAFVLRFMDPVVLFRNMIVAFEAASRNPLVVGVNIVAPEHGEVSMQDYWLHMQMFNYCHAKYDSVKYSLHAGELALGLVRPEELTWHISSAIYDGKANRIGHGVDMPYEKDCYTLLNYMRKNDIPVEINLYSNEFILKVKEDRHPILLYKQFKVPMVISTDDEGVLRTNLIEQYVLLAKRYPSIKYADIKELVYNSIKYSFIKEPSLKQTLKSQLDREFEKFEKKVMGLK